MCTGMARTRRVPADRARRSARHCSSHCSRQRASAARRALARLQTKLHELLKTARFGGKVLIVAASMGGTYAAPFVLAHPAQVAGYGYASYIYTYIIIIMLLYCIYIHRWRATPPPPTERERDHVHVFYIYITYAGGGLRLLLRSAPAPREIHRYQGNFTYCTQVAGYVSVSAQLQLPPDAPLGRSPLPALLV